MRKAYPSDISRAQYEMIKEELESCRKSTRPRKYDWNGCPMTEKQRQQC